MQPTRARGRCGGTDRRGGPRDAYRKSASIVAATRQAGADSVHPGYGFLAENADFAQAGDRCGPDLGRATARCDPPNGRQGGGETHRARRRRADHSGYDEADQSDGALTDGGETIGYPVMIKAAAGGGGRGMRLVRSQERNWPPRSRPRGRRPSMPSATDACCWNARSPARATSRCRCSPTSTATSCISASATARCSGATRS